MGRHLILSAASMSAALVLLAGCSNADEEPAMETAATSPEATAGTDEQDEQREEVAVTVTLDGSECSYDGVSEVSPGVLAITFNNNETDVGSGALLLRLKQDVTFDQFADAHQPEPFLDELPELAEPAGQIGRVLPNGEDSVTFPVESGKYVLLCLVDTDDPDVAASYLAHPAGLVVTG